MAEKFISRGRGFKGWRGLGIWQDRLLTEKGSALAGKGFKANGGLETEKEI